MSRCCRSAASRSSIAFRKSRAGIPHRHRRTRGECRHRHHPCRRVRRRIAGGGCLLGRQYGDPAGQSAGGGESVRRAVQHDAGLSDGWRPRAALAALASRFGYARATEVAASIGQFVAFALGFIGLLFNPILIFIAIFVYLAASSEAHMVALRAVSRGVPVSQAMVTQFATLKPDAHIDEAVQTLLATSQGEFPVVDGAGKPVGLLGRGDIIRAVKTLGPDARVADAMGAEMPTIGHRHSLEEAFKLLQEKQAIAVGITDVSGTPIGMVTSETIAEMMMLQDALPRGASLGPWSRPAGA
jgi:CBS domain-containing protein